MKTADCQSNDRCETTGEGLQLVKKCEGEIEVAVQEEVPMEVLWGRDIIIGLLFVGRRARV